MKQKYEIVIVVDPDQNEEGVQAMISKVEGIVGQHEGSVERVDNWGRRQLAYPINKKEYGTYVVLIATGNAKLVSELNRQLRIVDELLRFLVVHKDKYAPDFVPKAKEEGRPERRSDRGDRGERGSRERRPSRDESASSSSNEGESAAQA